MPEHRDNLSAPLNRDRRTETGVQRALRNVPDIKRHLRNAEAHIERARRLERRNAGA